MLTLLTLLPMTALAQEAAPPETPPAAETQATAEVEDRWDEVLHVVDRMMAAKDYDEARALLNWTLAQDPPDRVRQGAQIRFNALPREKDWGPRLRLLPWQTLMGAWLGGPNMLYIAESRGNYWYPAGTVFVGGLAGGAGGAAASLLYHRDAPLQHGEVSAILLGEQLGMANGAVLTLLLPDANDFEYAGQGLLGGALLGTAGGYLWASKHPGDGPMAGARAGTVWGLGLGSAAMFAAPGHYFDQEGGLHDWGSVMLAADVGTAAGLLLTRAAGLRRSDVQLITLGGIAGALTGGGFAMATQGGILWTEESLAMEMGVFAIAGGVGGWLVARDMKHPLPEVATGTLLSGTPEHLVVGLPLPSVTPTTEGLAFRAQLVSVAF